jgi:hypothetical protein
MKTTNLLLGLAPWVLFSVIAERVGADAVGIAAAIAGLGSLALVIRGRRTDGIKVIDAAGVLTFGVLATIGFLSDHAVRQDLVNYGRGGCTVVLALVMLVSAFTVPFSEQYARAQVDRRYWASPVFRQINRKISLAWSGLIAAMACSHLVAGAMSAGGSDRPILNLGLNWGVPVLVLVQGMKISERIAAQGLATEVVA